AVDAFRVVCAIDPLSRRRLRGGLAAISAGRRNRRPVFPSGDPALPYHRGAGDVAVATRAVLTRLVAADAWAIARHSRTNTPVDNAHRDASLPAGKGSER